MAEEQRRVWLQDQELAWVKALVENEGELGQSVRMITVIRDDGEGGKLQVEVDGQTGEGETVKTRNLFEEDSDVRGYEAVHDLTTLTHLHEAEILEALCVRFQNDQIYTYTGPILLALNPFKELKIYSENNLATYYSAGLLKAQQLEAPQLRPHVFAIADSSYRNLMDSTAAGSRMDQSILVSGESGAGKTETTKYVMRYLATVARAQDADPSEKGRAERVLESNPILESFGNARTNRNDNSSRFGKFIQMSFDSNGFLVGAQIATYLLEKVRLTKQANGERNFHVFYQMCAGASAEDREKWRLPDLEDSLYTNQSDVYDRRDGVSDEDQFSRTDEAFRKMRFSDDERSDIYSIASAVMNMGNIGFTSSEKDGDSKIEDGRSTESLSNVSALLEVDPDLLVTALTTKKITTGKETFVKPLDTEEAEVVRDALAKTIYSRLFDSIVKRVNLAISTDSAGDKAAKPGASKHSFIGVLDIFGFEVFEHNSFEQLCINYTNETLQQQFNEFVFQLEQKLYESEKIKWTFIDFPDNKPVLDLIEAKAPKPGILALLDEQCLFPQGNDKALANKLYDTLGGGAAGAKASPSKAPLGGAGSPSKSSSDQSELLLFASPADRVKFNFCVRHYAGTVTYSAIGFCAKNKDELREEVLALMRTSTKPLVLQLFPEMAAAKKEKSGSIQSETVGSQFKGQLASLLKTIKATSPHYIRCLKPNDSNVSDTLVRPRLVDQLRYGGVLEAVKVARAGYPTRFSLRDFVRRYFMLAENMKLAFSKRAQTFAADDERWLDACEMICNGPEKLEKGTQFQIGRTKVFMRKSAFEKLEIARSKVFKVHSTEIQKIMRGFIKRRAYVRFQSAIRLIQRMARGFIARRRAQAIRSDRAITKIQAVARQFIERSRFMRQKEAAEYIQKVVRGHAGRKEAKAYRIFVMATKIQCFYRRLKARHAFLEKKRATIVLQTRWRGLLARRELKVLRMQQKETGFLQEKIKELQNKIAELEEELHRERSSKGSTASSATVQRDPPSRDDQEEPLKKRVPQVSDVEVAELKKLVEEQASEISRLNQQQRNIGDSSEVADISLLTSQLQAQSRELEQVTAEKAAVDQKLSVLQEQITEIAEERDKLVQGMDPEELLAKALAEKDEAKRELLEVRALLEKKDNELAHSASSIASEQVVGAPSGERNLDNQQIENLKRQLDSLAKNHAQEIARLHDDYASKLNNQVSSSEDSSTGEHLTRVNEECIRLRLELEKVVEERDRIAEERDSLTALVSASPEDGTINDALAEREKLTRSQRAELESALKKVTDEHERLLAAIAIERDEHEQVRAERDNLASFAKASSEDERMKAFSEREKLFDQERSKLQADIQQLTEERDSLSSMLANSKQGNSDEDGSFNIELEAARITINALTLEKDVLVKEKEDLLEDKANLIQRLEEIEIMNSNLKEQLDEATRQAAPKKQGFFASRASVMAPSLPPASPLTTASGDGPLPTRSDLLASRVVSLEAKIEELSVEKDKLLEKVLNLTNDGNAKDASIRHHMVAIKDLQEKNESMELLVEQNSAIKMKLARRLDDYIQKTSVQEKMIKAHEHTITELEDRLAAMQNVSRVLNEELMNKSIISDSKDSNGV